MLHRPGRGAVRAREGLEVLNAKSRSIGTLQPSERVPSRDVATSTPTALGEGDEALGSDDDVIQERDAKELSGLAQSLGELDVMA